MKANISIKFKGGAGSGHHGHAGRPGKVGGSAGGAGASGGGAPRKPSQLEQQIERDLTRAARAEATAQGRTVSKWPPQVGWDPSTWKGSADDKAEKTRMLNHINALGKGGYTGDEKPFIVYGSERKIGSMLRDMGFESAGTPGAYTHKSGLVKAEIQASPYTGRYGTSQVWFERRDY